MLVVCTRMSSVFHSYVLLCNVISLGCTRMSSVCHSHLLVCHLYVTRMSFYATRMYSYIIRMSLVYTRMSLLCTQMYSYVIRMSLVFICMSFVCYSYVVLPWTFIACFDWKIGVFQQTVVKVFYICNFNTIQTQCNFVQLFELANSRKVTYIWYYFFSQPLKIFEGSSKAPSFCFGNLSMFKLIF